MQVSNLQNKCSNLVSISTPFISLQMTVHVWGGWTWFPYPSVPKVGEEGEYGYGGWVDTTCRESQCLNHHKGLSGKSFLVYLHM